MAHHFTTRVYYEDTDMGGIVYHANYLKFIERARSEWVEQIGLDQLALREAGLVFAVRRITAEFHAPARLGDVLEVTTTPKSVTAARLGLHQQVHLGKALLFEADIELVAMTLAGRPTRLPPEIRAFG
ncbi:tol-pal system-associated acyl-CoA thioesterase [Vannielia sp.]|uniref:tol-pal system-associated acyl-CoA thioesterase n=1 Tax=Vannielia sp. TaxID=2813045 RepID=UPI002629EE17|nr:tol-pal system-associated acyl-CoA thioesterase [Vannielia sp.]MDF1873291.1 tol-pal system-associated acyl-CoA thioesterase [Vannielia sp.]